MCNQLGMCSEESYPMHMPILTLMGSPLKKNTRTKAKCPIKSYQWSLYSYDMCLVKHFASTCINCRMTGLQTVDHNSQVNSSRRIRKEIGQLGHCLNKETKSKGHFTSCHQTIKEVIIEAPGIAFVPKGRKYNRERSTYPSPCTFKRMKQKRSKSQT